MRKIVLFIMAVLVCGAIGVFGRVFTVRDAGAGRLNTAGLGWISAYQTSMNVNGVHNDLFVYSVDSKFSAVDQVKAQFEEQGAEVEVEEIAGGYRVRASVEGQESRILILSDVGGRPNQMVFLFYPQPGKANGPATLPVPEFPGALSENVVSNDKTGSVCRTITTEADPARVIGFYATALSADGWSTVLPSGASDTRMALFQKGKLICSVLAAQENDGVNRVTVLVNGGGF